MTSSSPKFKPFPDKWDKDSILEHIIIHYRWVFVMFLLPVSLCYDVFHYARSFLIFTLNSAPKQHLKKVANIQRQVREWKEGGQQASCKPMCTARPGWQTISPQNMVYKSKMHGIHVNLVDILEVDTRNGVVKCEPMVTMGQLNRTLNRLGWTIAVLPELDDLTVGGLVMGTGIETTSHKYGLFQHICKSYELVLADGSVVECDEMSNPDLFYAVPWSYGTLGFLTSVSIQIVPVKRFIKIEYTPTYSLEETTRVFEAASRNPGAYEFVECLMYDKNRSVLMTGNMVDACEPDKLNEIGRWFKPWFFKHVEKFLDQKITATEYIPMKDYYHRHSRSIFWEIQDIIPFGNNIVFRYLFGWLIPPKVSLLKLTQGKTLKKLYEEHHMIQDMLVPVEHLKDSIEVFDDLVEIYPIWLCPFRLPNDPGMLKTPSGEEQLFVDVGVYGVPKRDNFDAVETTRKVEEFVRSVKGFQMMYADSYMSKEEFRAMFDHTLYDEMRERYQCKRAFPDIYDKINKAARSGMASTAAAATSQQKQ